MVPAEDLGGVVEEAFKGDRVAISKVITAIEEDPWALRSYFPKIFRGGDSVVIGITGSPGVGKSSLINHMIRALRARGDTVAVIAVDPASPYSGGAFLGNRVRVRTLDEGTFFRSMSTPPEESIPWKAVLAMEFLSSLGYSYVIIEHPGAGQVNVKIMDFVDVVVVVLQPLTGDDIQALKAGIMEIGDIYVVNKSDLPQAQILYMQLRMAIEDVERRGWRPPVIMTNSINGKGVEKLIEAIDSFIEHSSRSGLLSDRRRRRRIAEVTGIAQVMLREEFARFTRGSIALEVINKCLRGEVDFLTASETLYRMFIKSICNPANGASNPKPD
ncbi:MAG: methylmalonyl Co-A mutase-associated GTPase MeaB [Thermoprotei archaeon]|nr:MAG: methylmalonyl Co-A mutase-associated GTPase MeaB [Thermoprotei archaeon]